MLQLDGKVQKFDQVFHANHKACDCAMPMTQKKWNDALGTFVVIRICCMAKALEDLTGLDLYQVSHFQPKWEWDCNEMIDAEDIAGGAIRRPRGQPPPWLRERMLAKGITIKGLAE